MKQSTFSAQVATNLLNVLQGYTKGIQFLLVMFLTLTVTTNAWGQTWTRVTTMEQLTSGGTFIMGYEATANSGTIVPLRSADCNATTSANGYFHTGTTANSSTSSTITMSSVVNTSAYEVYISSPASGKINIQCATSTGNYYGASSGGSSKNTARLYTKGNTTETNLIVEWASETNNQFKLMTGVSGTYKYLKYNTSSPRFAFYNSAGEKIVFYKKSATSFTVTAKSNNDNYGTVVLQGTTITATPKTGYRVSTTTPYTISPSSSATVTQNGNTFTVTPSANTTITINFEALPKYTVTLKDDNSTLAQSAAGATITLPSRDGCDGYEFVGWTKSWSVAQTTWTTTAPTIIPKGSYTPTANESLYPVYTKTEGGGSEPTAYSAGDVGSFIIASNVGNKWYAIPENPTLSSSKITGVEITVSQTDGGVKYVSTANAEGYTWTIADATNGQTISDGSKYIYHSNGGSSGTNLAYGTSTSYTWKIEKENNGLTFKGMNGSTTNSRGLLFNGSIFGGYALSNEDASGYYRIQVLPIGGGSTTYYISVPDCTTETSYSVTIDSNIENGGVTANPTSATAGTEIELTATPDKGYQFSSWIVTKEGGGTVEITNNKFTMPASNVIVSATFVTIPQLDTPTNLQVTNISCNEVTLSWDAVTNKSSYTVAYRDSKYTNTKTKIYANMTTVPVAPGTTYDWTVQAIGNGTTYADSQIANGNSFTTSYKITYDVNSGSWTACADGCVAGGEDFTICSTVPTKTGYDFMGWSITNDETAEYQASETITDVSETITLYAVWKLKTYTIRWVANGHEFHKQEDATHGTDLAVPSAPETYACDDKVFVGWTATPIDGSTDTEPADLFTTKTAKVEDAATTYYAVFATEDGGGVENVDATLSFESTAQRTEFSTSKQVWTQNGIILTNEKGSSTTNVADYANPARFYKSSDITITAPGNITQIVFTCNTEEYATNLATSIGDPDLASGTIVTLILNGTSDSYEVTLSAGQVRMNSLTVTYTTGSGTSYSDYSTVCEAIPDPVWGGAVINRNSIKVDCGSMTKLNAADPNGPATISFPAATNHTLTYGITVTASEGFRVSTNKTDAAKYGASVTVSPNKTGDNAGKITQNVYVVAVAPAMSDEDFTGTITLSGKQLAENQVIDVTADVTCTTYTLTLDDRGTKTTAEYYAGASVPKPAAPEGVCTDPINYVFDGWSLDPVTDENTTSYEEVTFPFDMPAGKTTLYAVYRYVEDGSADSGDYVKLTEDLDDYSGDYLIVYETGKVAFNGGLEELDETSNTIAVTISSNTIKSNATTDAAKVTIAKVDGGYSIKSASGYYIGWGGEKNGLNTNSSYTVNYLNTITDKSTICGKTGYLKFNKTSGQERFRYYQSGQETIALYRKAASYLYTTSPVCGPHLAITEGKEIYVTGGNAQAARDLVMAQQKVSYKATRLNTKDGSAGGTAPDVVVANNGITKNGIVTSEVKVTFENTIKEQQADGTYTITGDIVVTYEAEANNLKEDIQVQLAADYNAEAKDNFTVHARSLPSEFVIVAKSGDKWYALNADMSSSKAQPANGQVTLNDLNNPTEAIYAPCNAIYTFEAMPQGAEDRKSVRFIGQDNKYLWAASGTNTGIQNNSTNPAADALAYNWKLYTEDNITYRFGNANSSRQLTLSSEKKFGMYASGVQDIRILPYEAKCLYNYAPSNLKVSVLKGTYVTLTWDAVAGATKYQYSTDASNWIDAGTEPTVTISGLSNGTDCTYYIRAYHADAGVSQECFDYSEVSFTTADCDDVPTDITYTADLNSITVSWTASAATATIKLYLDEAGEHAFFTQSGATSPWKISSLQKNTTYYLQIFAGGTCASQIIPVKTEDVEVDIVEWDPQGIIVDINTDETIGVTLENEVSYGSGTGADATELFFSKYYEATTNVKLVAIYNGTKNIIDLTDYEIHYGKTPEKGWETNYITLKDFGEIKGQIQPGEELILYTMSDSDNSDKQIMNCVNAQYPNGKWVRVTQANNTGKGSLSFAGDKTIVLKKAGTIIDIIGAINSNGLPNNAAVTRPSWGDAYGWTCATGLSIADDTEIGISTNRCLLIRNNTVTSGENAVTNNIDNFNTLCSEWKGAQVPDSDEDNGVAASCENFAYVGTFDYSDYYTQYESMGNEKEFDENDRNPDGTVTIPITDLYKHACSNIRVKLTNSTGEVLSDREYKVPIMITTTQGTDGQAFLDLQQNLATKEVDAEGNVIRTYPLSLDKVREICKTCDVVVRDNATLTKVTDGTTNDHPQVHDVIVYEGASIVIPDGTDHNYTINSLALRRKGDEVASAQVKGTGKFVLPAEVPVTLSMRIDANNWHWFTLPYDCDIADVTWSDGTEAKYNTDWFLMYYDGESRSNQKSNYESHWKVYNGTTIEAGKGYIIGITGDLTHPNYTFELRFPMAQEVLAAEQTDKTVAVNAWGVKKDIRPNHKGWNLVGNPYMDYYQPNTNGFAGLPLIKYLSTNSAGEWLYDESGTIPFLVIPQDGGWSEYKQELASDVDMQPFTAYFVQVGDPANEGHSDGMELNASFETDKRGRSPLIRRAPSEVEELEEPAIVAVSLTNAKGESDKTTLLIADRFTNEYEMNADFFKWFGDYYTYYTKPVLYTLGADNESRAFNALNEELAAQPVALGMYAAQAGNYTFSLHQRSNLTGVAEVWLHDASNNTHTNLLQDDYTFSTSKTKGSGRFSLSVKMIQKLPTDVENIKQGNVWATTQDNEIVINGLTKDMQLWIYDATGKLVHADRSTNYQHSYSVPQTGAYFIRVQNKNGAQTIKVVVE